ncbi:hypothetical protein CsSME_00009503 [Camellia sinensis var. sinensis]
MVRAIMVTHIAIMTLMMIQAKAWDTNHVFDPCLDAKVKRYDGFTFGLAFSTKESFIFNETQLSPCDRRLLLAGSTAQLAMFKPKVDEISLLTLNGTQFNPVSRSVPIFVADMTNTVTSFTLIRPIQSNLMCKCLNSKRALFKTCIGRSLGVPHALGSIQLAFSGTDKNKEVLNLWYEVANLRQYSLFALYSNLRETLTGPFGNLF